MNISSADLTEQNIAEEVRKRGRGDVKSKGGEGMADEGTDKKNGLELNQSMGARV